MSINEEEKLDRVEKLKSKLFSRGYETQSEHNDNFSFQPKINVVDSWPGAPKKSNLKDFFMKTSIFKKFFIFSVSFFILAIGYVSYMFFAGGNTVSNENIDVNILGNTFTAGGEKLPLVIEIVNRNNTPLDLVDLVVEYPKGSTSDLFSGTERLRSSLGTIATGATKSETVDIVLFGEQGSVRNVKISLEYRIEGSNAIFVKEKNHEVSINSTPIDLTVDAPAEVSPNQDVIFKIKVATNTINSAPKVLVKLDYPVGFQFISSTPAPAYDNNVWNFGDMPAGSEQNISILGKMVDVYDGDQKTFHIFGGTQSEKDKSEVGIVFNSLGHNISIRKPFIEAKLSVNGSYKREYAVSSKTTIFGQVNWKNNLDTKVNDLSIIVRISGNIFDPRTINASPGFYNSVEDYLIWDKNTVEDFSEVGPGETGAITFSVSPLPLYSASSGLASNPSFTVDVSITGKQSLEGNILKELKNSDNKIVKMISDVGFTAKTLYYSGPFKNTGPIPPKAEEETTYTITWGLTNTANNISKVQVRSSIPPWVRFTGMVSPSNENVTYDSTTREIVWNALSIPKGAGITRDVKEVSFQLALIPSTSQIGERPVLLNKASLTGYDDFANVNIQGSKPAFNTMLTGEPLSVSGNGTVTE